MSPASRARIAAADVFTPSRVTEPGLPRTDWRIA